MKQYELRNTLCSDSKKYVFFRKLTSLSNIFSTLHFQILGIGHPSTTS